MQEESHNKSTRFVKTLLSTFHPSYPSESHLVKGHSHMPLKSGLPMSEAKNSSCGKPGRSSHSGTHPAPGASRTNPVAASSVSAVAANRAVVACDVAVVVGAGCGGCGGAKATTTAVLVKLESNSNFILRVAVVISILKMKILFVV